MIQRWESACKVLEHINDLIKASQSSVDRPTYPQIQKVWSSLALVSLSLRFQGQSRILNLSKSAKFFAIFLSAEKAPSEWRSKDKTQDWLRSKLAGRRLKRISYESDARILTFYLDHPNGEDVLAVYYHSDEVSHLYYDVHDKTLWTSWAGARSLSPEDLNVLNLFQERSEIRFYGPSGVEKDFDYADFNSIVSAPGKILRRVKKGVARKKEKIINDLKKNEALISVESSLARNEIDLAGKNKLVVGGLSIKLPLGRDHFAKRDYLFGKIKGAKKGIEITKKRLLQVESNTQESIQELVASPYQWEFANPKRQKVLQPSVGVTGYELFKIGAFKAGIGKTAQGNDGLRKEFNKKKAIWFHTETGTSPHVIVGTENFADLTSEQVAIIGSMMRDQMNSNFSEISLIYTQLKNLKPVTGTAGKVIYSNIKYIKVNYLSNWETLIR